MNRSDTRRERLSAIALASTIGLVVSCGKNPPTSPAPPANTNTAPAQQPTIITERSPSIHDVNTAPMKSTHSAVTAPAPDSEWEKLLRNDTDHAGDPQKTAEKIFSLAIELDSKKERQDAVETALLLLDINQYDAPLALLLETETPSDIRETIFDDLMERPLLLRLPALLDIAREKKHPFAMDARVAIEAEIQQNYGTNWASWMDAIELHLEKE